MAEQNVSYNIKQSDGSYKELRMKAYDLNGHGTDNGPNSVLLSGRAIGTTIGINSTAEGYYTTASGDSSHAEGYGTQASGNTSHAEGYGTQASGYASHAEGHYTTASGDSSHAEGDHAQANTYVSHAQGKYNKALAGDPSTYSTTADAMVIGNGTNATDGASNCFRITFDGKVYGLSAFNSSGADYSEFFEWSDENPNAEDRVGHFVTLDGEKIRYANDGDYIVGIVSGAPAIIGDHPSESWSERWVKDVFGRLQYEDVTIPAHDEKDKSGKAIRTIPEHTETHFKVNPDYDPAKEAEYANREKRPEWATVGMLGKLVVIDDGTCEVNGYCKPKNGTATKSDTGYRVLARLDETHIKVLIK